METQNTLANKALIKAGFEGWSAGTGNFFDLLHDEMNWTISGSTPYSRTYIGKKAFMEEVIIPLNERLSKKIIPKMRGIYAEDDMVIALWDGKATAVDGKPYDASYSWYMRVENEKIIEVVAFLDGMEFTDIMQRISV